MSKESFNPKKPLKNLKPWRRGFTLLEVMVAMAIFALVAGAMLPAFLTHLKFNVAAEERNGAMAATRQILEELRLEDPESLPSSGSSGPQDIAAGERSYQVTLYYCRKPLLCSTRSRHLEVEASYRGQILYDVETVFTRLK